jgi:hypothetical protein
MFWHEVLQHRFVFANIDDDAVTHRQRTAPSRSKRAICQDRVGTEL